MVIHSYPIYGVTYNQYAIGNPNYQVGPAHPAVDAHDLCSSYT